MSQTEALRASILQEAQGFGSRRRFGLFSSPIPTAVGDDGQYKSKLHPRDQSGKPVTSARGIYTNPNRSGQVKKSYFGDINSLATGIIHDQYVDPGRKMLQLDNETFRKGYTKEQAFKPASGFKETAVYPFEYKEGNNPELDPKRNREEDGKVKSAPRNFFTNQQSTVIRSFFKPNKYIEDPYERAHQMSVDYANKQKALEHEAKFKLNPHPKSTFGSPKQIFGSDVELPEKKIKETQLNIYKHQNRWKSNNASKSAPFPAYMENPPKQTKKLTKEEVGKDGFKRMSVASSRPSPSIALNRSNLIGRR